METNKKNRFHKVIGIWVGLIVLGLFLGVILKLGNWYLPCPIRTITGYLCPGCGTTRMFLALMELEFAAAFKYNPVVFSMIPLFIWLFISMSINYVNRGEMKLSKNQEKIIIIMIIVLVIFGIIRNF